jgi:hypothetical protein
MALTSLEGPMGSGKSLTAVALTYTDHMQSGRRVIANMDLKFEHTQLTLEYFLEHLKDEELNECDTILDETYLLLEARRGMGKLNLLFTYFIGQTRKRNVDLFLCFHHIDTIEKRVRRAIDIRGTCSKMEEFPCKLCKGSGWLKHPPVIDSSGRPVSFKLVDIPEEELCSRCLGYGFVSWLTTKFYDMRINKRSRIRIYGNAFFGLYETKELVPFSAKQMSVPIEDLTQ